jgi:fatty acid desaturase
MLALLDRWCGPQIPGRPGVVAASPPGTDLHPVSYYVHELKPRMPAIIFQPAPSRLVWLPIHLLVIAAGTIVIAQRWLPWPLIPLVSVVIGMSFGGLMFLGHEVLHGAVVRGRWNWLRPIVGWICFAPFAVSQQLWLVWHNRVHHANTNRLGVDPDMFTALHALHRTGRVYKDATTLLDPRTGGEWPTLAPRELAASAPRAAS